MTYYSPSDVRSAFPQLDPDAPIPLSEFASLITDYRFKKLEYVRCQLQNEGHLCAKPHGFGYIGVRADGVIGWIGNVCAENHCKTNLEFAAKFQREADRIAREKKVGAFVQRIASQKATDGLAGSMRDAVGRCRNLANQISQVRRELPTNLLTELADRVKRGNSRIDAFSERTEIEVDDHGRERRRVKMEPFVLGVVASPDGLDIEGVKGVAAALQAAANAIENAIADSTIDEEQLRSWSEALDAYPIARSALEASERAFQSFMQSENLKLLPWLVRSGKDQDHIAAYILRKNGKRDAPSNAQSAMGTWRYEIMQREGGWPFKLA